MQPPQCFDMSAFDIVNDGRRLRKAEYLQATGLLKEKLAQWLNCLTDCTSTCQEEQFSTLGKLQGIFGPK